MKRKLSIRSIEKQIKSKIAHKGRGAVFFSNEFINIGRSDAIRQALSRQARTGIIRRIGIGLYHYPAINKKLGGELPPSADIVAKVIAKRTNSKIVATGALAANLLGLTTQVQAKRIYLTNGPSRDITVGTFSLSFRHVAPKRIAVRGEISALIFEALRYLKQGHITKDMFSRLKESLPARAKNQLKQDLKYAAIWMRQPLLEIIGERI